MRLICQNGNHGWNQQPQQTFYQEEKKSPEAESFDPINHFPATIHRTRG